jgi:small subunit ribosomal protein S8
LEYLELHLEKWQLLVKYQESQKQAGKINLKKKIMVTDPISDYLTRLRNAIAAKHKVVEIPGSNLKKAMTQILMDQGFILNFKVIEDSKQGIIKIALKYNNKTKDSAIKNLTRISKPGLRKYSGVDTMPRVLNGLGIAIVSTSRGLITDKEARKQKVGGEILCYVD